MSVLLKLFHLTLSSEFWQGAGPSWKMSTFSDKDIKNLFILLLKSSCYNSQIKDLFKERRPRMSAAAQNFGNYPEALAYIALMKRLRRFSNEALYRPRRVSNSFFKFSKTCRPMNFLLRWNNGIISVLGCTYLCMQLHCIVKTILSHLWNHWIV